MMKQTLSSDGDADEPPLSTVDDATPFSSLAMPTTWTREREDGERGLFARVDIPAGEIVVIFGGRVIGQPELELLPRGRQRFALQIESGAFLYSDHDGPGDWVNHSCAPNLGLIGQVVLVTIAPVRRGEELTFDYAMTDATDYDSFICRCEAPLCRGEVTGNDWRLAELQERYRGHFAPHIQRLIDAC